jgi:hypothetical protein
MLMPAQLLVSLLERDPEEENPDKVPINASGDYSANRASRMEHQGLRPSLSARGSA